MGLLDVNTPGLQTLAANCGGWAAELTTSPATGAVSSGQATAAAVATIHAEAGLAGQALAARMHSTAAKLTDAAVQYRSTEAESTTQLTGLTTEL